MTMAAISIFRLPPHPLESSSPNAAKEGASLMVRGLMVGNGAASCVRVTPDGVAGDGKPKGRILEDGEAGAVPAGSASIIRFILTSGVVVFAGAAAAADPGTRLGGRLVFWAGSDAGAMQAISFPIPVLIASGSDILLSTRFGEVGRCASAALSGAVVICDCDESAGAMTGLSADAAGATAPGGEGGAAAARLAGSNEKPADTGAVEGGG